MKKINKILIEISLVLKKKKLKLALAESITGGLISKKITDIPGASEWFDCGLITYTNASKNKILGIQENFITEKGSVSKEITERMANEVLKKSNAEVCLAITGYAGPSGDNKINQVGKVYFCWASKRSNMIEERTFKGNRKTVRKKSAEHSLKGLLKFLKENEIQ
tara:strand:- start:876 stop:1370 length:495 start_codon:yes stop_codon:yes gene_type:complete